MPDLDDLRRLPRHTPPPGGLSQVTGEARRRQRRLATGGAGALALSAALFIAVGGTSGTDTLRQSDVPGAGSRTSPTPVASTPDKHPPASAHTLGTVAPLQPGRPAASTAGGHASTSVSPAPGTGRKAPSQDMHRTYSHDAVGGTVCPGIVTNPAAPGSPKFCGGVDATTAPHGYADFTITVCLDRGSAAGANLTFASTKEVDVALFRNGKQVWLWSGSRTFRRQSHALPLTAGDCYAWTTSWNTTDAAGRALPHGDYDVRGTTFAAELGSANTWTGTLTL